MKKQYFVLYGDFANTYALFYAETPADVAALPAGAERITYRDAVALCKRERDARRYSPMSSGYADTHIYPATWPEHDEHAAQTVRGYIAPRTI